ncbi:MAG TPA: hypothetical protein VLH84_05530 [Patescibacteria group bacterium]|nr:hypothetical protein [Patescibacteria group bacterium]
MSELLRFPIACKNQNALAARLRVAPIRVISDAEELAANGYQPEGVVIPDIDRLREPTLKELEAIAVPLETEGALRLVHVSRDMGKFALELDAVAASRQAVGTKVLHKQDISISTTPPHARAAAVNPAIAAYVGMHIDALVAGDCLDSTIMGVTLGPSRWIALVPSITSAVIPEHLVGAVLPEQRQARREAIRAAAREIDPDAALCLLLRVAGARGRSTVFEAYANLPNHSVLHDGVAFDAGSPTTVMLLSTPQLPHTVFPSVV